jgi:hypothetical protein
MKSVITFLILVLLNSVTVYGDHTGMLQSSNYAVFSIPAEPPESVYEVFFANEVAANHLTRIGTASNFFNLSPTEPLTLTFWYAWRDGPPGTVVELSPPYFIVVPAGGQASFNTPFIIPVAPSRVGIRIQNNGPGGPAQATGSLSRRVVSIPEPGGAALVAAGAAAAGFGAIARRMGGY